MFEEGELKRTVKKSQKENIIVVGSILNLYYYMIILIYNNIFLCFQFKGTKRLKKLYANTELLKIKNLKIQRRISFSLVLIEEEVEEEEEELHPGDVENIMDIIDVVEDTEVVDNVIALKNIYLFIYFNNKFLNDS